MQVEEQSKPVPNISLPLLPLHWSWLHACVAFDSVTHHLTVVVNGENVEDKRHKVSERAKAPNSLAGKLLLAKMMAAPGVWYQHKGKVANLNVFSGMLTVESMVQRTAGKDCGKDDGDYLQWEQSKWKLNGLAKIEEVAVEDLCRTESSIEVFTERLESAEECAQLCSKVHPMGRIASVETAEQFSRLVARMTEISSEVVWLPIAKTEKGWVDRYTGEQNVTLTKQPNAQEISSWSQLGLLEGQTTTQKRPVLSFPRCCAACDASFGF